MLGLSFIIKRNCWFLIHIFIPKANKDRRHSNEPEAYPSFCPLVRLSVHLLKKICNLYSLRYGKYTNYTKTLCQVQERLLSLAICIIYISWIVNELYREYNVKHINFYIARYVFDTGHIMSRQELCLGQLFPMNELSWGKLVSLLFSSMANKDNAWHSPLLYVWNNKHLIWFFPFHQHSFSYVGTSLPGLNQY